MEYAKLERDRTTTELIVKAITFSELRTRNKQGLALAFACKPLILDGAEAGIEPARPYERGILSPSTSYLKSASYRVYFSAYCEFRHR
ncbi:hypothetical protein LOY28_13315 [Pseudomonas sp. B21-017]|uniref:hypothetical protein n=1 Tax=Pseudomonas sp. B21-017 TaxID=2895474 RepID=UPI00215E2242|nr:hypothetical protein [Pseudomonas sp. B21-017]UVM41324.1 hypothetical protein LOY28_13315 [Pseudomonas sp. B21-017]